MSDQLRGPNAFPYGGEIEAVAEVYGDPAKYARERFPGRFPDVHTLDEGQWRKATLATLPVPFPSAVRISGTKTMARQVYCHRLIRESLVEILTELADTDLWRYVTDYAGCYNYRLRRGSNRLSLHAWGAAIDLNAERYPLNCPPDKTDPFIAQVLPVFKKHGWNSGADWSKPIDAQHCQATTGA